MFKFLKTVGLLKVRTCFIYLVNEQERKGYGFITTFLCVKLIRDRSNLQRTLCLPDCEVPLPDGTCTREITMSKVNVGKGQSAELSYLFP